MISLSERAAEKVRELLADEADAETLRVAVQGEVPGAVHRQQGVIEACQQQR